MQSSHRRNQNAASALLALVRAQFGNGRKDFHQGRGRSNQIACRAKRNRRCPKSRHPAACASSESSRNEKARSIEARASFRVIASRKTKVVIRSTPNFAQRPRRKSATSTLLAGKFATAAKQRDRFFGREMVQGEGKKYEVVGFRAPEVVDVVAVIMNFGKSFAQLLRNPNRRCLQIHRVDAHRGADSAGELHHQSRNVARAGGEIDDAQVIVRSKPASQEMSHQTIAAKVAIKRAQITKVRDQLRRNRLRPVHPFRFRGVEAPLQCGRGLCAPISCCAFPDRGTKAPPTLRFMRGTSATNRAARPSPPRSQCGLRTRPGTRCWYRRP